MKRIIFSVFLIGLFLSCSKSDEITPALSGVWYLQKIDGGFSAPRIYNTNEVTWNFNNNNIIIENNVDVFNTLNVPDFSQNQGGTYSFEIVTENGSDYLIVGDRKGKIDVSQYKLVINYGVALDDIAYIFYNRNDIFSTTCGTDNSLEDLAWLRNIKRAFEQSASAVKREIYQYTYEGNTVFLVDDCASNCNDALQVVYNCNGDIICEFGGIAGLNTCPNFLDTATNKILLWEN